MAASQTALGNRVSTVLARRLGGELLRLRDAAGLTQPQAAQVLSATAAKVAKMERGWVPFRDPDVVALCKLYGETDEAVVGGLLALAKLDRERRKAKGWWQHSPDAGSMAEYIAMEDVATKVRTWQLSLIPGLLQTADYARALAVSDEFWQDPDDIERVVAIRVKRQNRLWSDVPLQVHAVIWEGALRQEVGGVAVMSAQLAHLLQLADMPNVHVQVLPFRAGGHPCIVGPFNVISFAEADAMDVVHVDVIGSTVWVESREQSAEYSRYFDRTARMSLAPRDSIDLIDDIRKGFQA
ncbi:helix-turn-helix transcriptional regulator [Streptomyces sp. KS 21]|uniref:helix-turn-helix domain-containing protein n=1 Tax=Streptomyces sp. KS 21 TaxID=2485150 RepID=UPI0010ED8C78|nr:helix-turn-helix transcriptional regulator [Streptomyces sp. KS 21]TDU77102.1 helix-turn-helix protein [Streptomyces sp. KS 21]